MRTIGVLAVLPAFAGRALAAGSSSPLAPPDTPMRFTRSLTRELSGGYSVVATRNYEIAFSRHDHGFEIKGEQVSASVDAPANLEAFARLERERIERGLFPMRIGWGGLILSCPDSVPSASLSKAVDLALARIAGMPGDADTREEARSFVLQLQQAAGQIANDPPANLFVPPSDSEQVTRTILLPGGEQGIVTSAFSGRISSRFGLMETAERIVTTEAEGSVRRTREQWTLDPID
jgi:hypothetical protein